jgi:hypothetical protein
MSEKEEDEETLFDKETGEKLNSFTKEQWEVIHHYTLTMARLICQSYEGADETSVNDYFDSGSAEDEYYLMIHGC